MGELHADPAEKRKLVAATLARLHVRLEARPFRRLAFRIIVEKCDQRAVAIAGIAAHGFCHNVALAFLASSRRKTVNPWYNRVFTVLNGHPTSSAIS